MVTSQAASSATSHETYQILLRKSTAFHLRENRQKNCQKLRGGSIPCSTVGVWLCVRVRGLNFREDTMRHWEAPLGGVLISRIPVIFWPNIPYPINSVTNIPELKYRPFFIGGGSWIMDHNYSLFFAFFSKLFIIHFIFSRDIHYSFFSFCINFPFRNFLQCNSIHWFSKVYISVYTKPYL